ncbi:MYND-type domain-containing protein [Mycena venus]|uniref:MYND-type domain-containing protein n=1 Tax=Mycena venus TaxID=2733690 RepID=A0A8H6XZ97_9AGAR|nr:MYND-type domain-containing protein [Mycena venus]
MVQAQYRHACLPPADPSSCPRTTTHMHPELNPSKLSTLCPLALRQVAKIVADGSAPAEVVSGAFRELLSMWRRDPNPRQAARNLLPVIFALLDPERQPDPEAATHSVLHLRLFGVAGAMSLFILLGSPLRRNWGIMAPGVGLGAIHRGNRLRSRRLRLQPSPTPCISAAVAERRACFAPLLIVTQFSVIAGDNEGFKPFWKSLGSAGLCRILTHTLIVLAGHSSSSEVQAVVAMSVNLLISVIQSFKRLVEALHADLLCAIILCSASHGQSGVAAVAFEQLLRPRLIGATLYYPVVIALASALPKALAIENTSGFMNSSCWETWKSFIVLAKERLQSMEQFESNVRGTGACGNFECGVLVARRTDLRCCGACRVFHYCSVECQTKSWGTQGHRTVCAQVQENPFPYRLGNRANRFYFFAILRDYQTRKTTILLQKLAYIHLTGNSNFCVVMEYVDGRCAPRVAPMDEWRHILDEHPYFEHIAIGCNEPHVIQFVDEGVTDCLACGKILRCDTSAIIDGLRRIARRIPPKADVAQLEKLNPTLYEEFQALARLEVVETYC